MAVRRSVEPIEARFAGLKQMKSFYESLLCGVLFPIGDYCRGVPVGKALRMYEESQWWPEDKLKEFQNQKLRRLIAESYDNVPYYRDVMEFHGLKPQDVQTAEDLVKLPLLTSEALQGLNSKRMMHRQMCVDKLKMIRTSGSTGRPKEFYCSKRTQAYGRAGYYRAMRWCGGGRGESHFVVWGRPLVMSKRDQLIRELKYRFVTRATVLSTWEMGPEEIRQFITAMGRGHPPILRGYASSLAELARFVQDNGIKVPPVKAVSTTAEQVFPEDRRLIEIVFGAPVFDQYGCGECNGIAAECDHHQGLHVFLEHCIIEIVDPEGHRVPPGTSGMVAVTNLDNEAYPFIRYLCGDEAALLAEPCSCGRGLPLMSPIDGRTVDTIYGINGNKVWGGFFAAALMNLGLTASIDIRQFQFKQVAADRLLFYLVSGQRPTADQLETLYRALRQHLGQMEIELHQVQEIELSSSGKHYQALREWDPPTT